jgi:anaerobic dimethyl sulfoxide reductase subunit C
MHEWPLLIFTLLLQGAVGLTLFLCVALCGDKTHRNSANASCTQMRLPLFMVCVMAGLGLLASVFHLGYPLNAFNALRHFSRSWLSREIVFASLFLAFAGLGFLAQLFKGSLWKGLMLLALLLGLVDVYCMSQIYMHTSVTTWMHANTLVMFYGSVAIVGAVAASMLLPLRHKALSRWTVGLVAAAVLIRLLTQIPYLSWLAQAGLNDTLTFPHQPLEAFRATSDVRLWGWGLSVVGALAFVCGMLRARKVWLLAGGILLLVAEVLLRFAFFSIR